MTACVVSSLVSQLLSRDSIYTSKLRRQGVDLEETTDPNVLKSLYVRDVIDDQPEVLADSDNFQTILDLVVQSDHSQFFVESEDGRLLGAISLSEVRRLIYEQEALRHLVVARDLVNRQHPSVTPDNDLSVVMQIFSGTRLDELAVVDPAHPGRLLGTVSEKDVSEVSQTEQLRRDLAGGFSSSMTAVSRGKTVDLGDGYWLREILAPAYMFGRSLGELAIRERTGVQVVLVRGQRGTDGGKVRVAGAQDRFQEGETLIVAGSLEGLNEIERPR